MMLAFPLSLCLAAIVALAHLMNGRVPNWAFLFLPLVFFVPAVFTVELNSMLGWLGLLLIVAGSFATYFGDKAADNEKNERAKARMSTVAGLGFAATMIGAVLAFVDQVKSGGRNEAAQEKIAKLSEKNVKLSESNLQLTKENANFMTGGDSIVYIKFIHKQSGGVPRAVIEVEGAYDVPNVSIDYYKLPTDLSVTQLDDQEAYYKDNRTSVFPPLNIAAVGGMREMDFKYPTDADATYIISLSSGRKNFAQLVHFRRDEHGKYSFAYRVYKTVGIKEEKLQLIRIPELSYTDIELSPTRNHIVPELDFEERFNGMNFLK